MIPLTKIANLTEDAPRLVAEYARLATHPGLLLGQHDIRKWEYGMALAAIDRWRQQRPAPHPLERSTLAPLALCDVGGASSYFRDVLTSYTTAKVYVVDPALGVSDLTASPEFVYVASGVETFAPPMQDYFDIVTCISVLEHIQQPKRFLRALASLVKPGGLLFLTVDYWDAEGPDEAHFNWMRERIYNRESCEKMVDELRQLGYSSFGGSDWSYPGHQVYNYNVCSLALTKKVRTP